MITEKISNVKALIKYSKYPKIKTILMKAQTFVNEKFPSGFVIYIKRILTNTKLSTK